MVINERKIFILKAVAKGDTFKHAAQLIGISPSNARICFNKICRDIGVTPDQKYVQANKKEVLRKLESIAEVPAMKLPRILREKLLSVLNLKNIRELTPELVSNIVGARLLHTDGFGPGTLFEVQKWLKANGHTLRITTPVTTEELRDVDYSTTILEIYGIKVNHNRNHIVGVGATQ